MSPYPRHVSPAVLISTALDLLNDDPDTTTGICFSCGAEADCCEPDARNYVCETCNEHSVFGASETLLNDGHDHDNERKQASRAKRGRAE